jgi:hypothetical protein
LKPNRRNEPFALSSLLSAKIDDLNDPNDNNDLNEYINQIDEIEIAISQA